MPSNFKYLITGASGFLGNYLTKNLSKSSFQSLGRSSENDISFDLSCDLKNLYLENNYQFVLHLAGLAHVFEDNEKNNYLHEKITVDGTKKLLAALNISSLKGFVFISTVAVYGEYYGVPFTEDSQLKGLTSYAKAKIKAEEIIQNWSISNNIPCLILRLPLVVGKNPPGNLGAMIDAIKSKRYFSIGNAAARRSMVMAEDVVNLILTSCGKDGIYNLSDGIHPTYNQIESTISKALNLNKPISIPFWLAKILAVLGDNLKFIPINTYRLNKLTQDLILNDTKARNELEWSPKVVIENFDII
jgi:nucleoside-diphosphate-sugar epimerase